MPAATAQHRKGAKHRALLCIALLAAGATGACGIVWDAPDITLQVGNDGIRFGGAHDRERLVGGETVLKIVNDSGAERRVILAKVDAATPDELPQGLLEAEAVRDDRRIVAMTRDLDPREARLDNPLLFDVDQQLLHVYLKPGASYVLFDALPGGLASGVFLQMTPGST